MSELGETLRAARERRGLSIADVSCETRIGEVFLEALERGEYGQIPGPAYVMGFLRTYARAVGLHPDDAIQEYYALRPASQPSVKAATRVLANGHLRNYRRRLLWGVGGLALALGGAFTVKEYTDQYNARAAGAPPLRVTPANTGGIAAPVRRQAPAKVREGHATVRLRARAPVLVRVTVDGRRMFDGLLRAGMGPRVWTGRRTVFVVAYNGSLVRATINGRRLGILAPAGGLVVESVTPSGFQRVS